MLKELLTGLGAGCEFVGILLVASPELVPRLGRVWRALRKGVADDWRRLVTFLRRRQDVVVQAASSGGAVVGGHASGFVSVNPDASLEEKVAFLLDRDRKNQQRAEATERSLAEHPKAWRRDIETARDELETDFLHHLERERDAYIGRRLVGIVVLLVGVPLLAVANVV